MDLSSPVIKFKPSQSGLPIPTLPISSGTASQAAHIASLTSQVEELVNKNTSLSSQHDSERREWESRLAEERTRAEEAVRRLRDGHTNEVHALKEGLETIQVAAKHHMLMMAYAHDATKRTVASLETDLENSTQQLQVKTLELKVAKSEELRLKFRIEEMEADYRRKLAVALAQYEEAQIALVASQNKISTAESKHITKLNTDLQAALSARTEAETAYNESQDAMRELEESCEQLSLELKEEKRERKEVEKQVKELKDQIANWKRLEGKEADNVKESNKRVRELEISLATERSRVSDLESQMEESEAKIRGLEKGMKKSEKEKNRLEDEKESLENEKRSLEKQLKEDKKKKTAKSSATGAGSEKENHSPEDVPTKTKKRQRDDSDVEELVERVSKKAKPEPKGKTKEKQSKPTTAKSRGGIYEPAPVTFSPVDHVDQSEEEFFPPIVKGPSVLPKINGTTTATKSFPGTSKPTATKKYQRPDKGGNSSVAPGLRSIYGSDEDEEVDPKWIVKGAVDLSPGTPPKKAKKIDKGKGKVGEEREEYFDVDAVSETEDEEDEPVIVKTEPATKKRQAEKEARKEKAEDPVKKKTEAPKKISGSAKDKNTDATKEKKPSEQSRKPSASQPSQASTTTENGGLGIKPKKKGINLLAGVTGKGGLGVADSWMVRGDQAYGIPTILSSPEKGAGPVPRARFDFGRGY